MSKEKQIKEMANDIAAMCPDLVNSGCGDLSCVACLAKGFEQMGYRKQEWISVEERLPETCSKVLVCCSNGEIFSAKYIRVQGLEFWFVEACSSQNITHWMPLPEAPKMKGGLQE